MQTFLARLALVFAAMLVALLVAEVAVRMLPAPAVETVDDSPDDGLWADPEWRAPPPHVFLKDPVIGHVNAPLAVADVKIAEHENGAFRFRTNSLGLRRDGEIDIPKPPGTFRIVVLGDSQTSGYGTNNETYPGQLEAIWKSRLRDRDVEVVNAGVDGYSPQQAYLWYRERGAPLQADLVIFGVYTGNDAADVAASAIDGAVIDDDGGLIGPLRTPVLWLSFHSRLARRVEPFMRTTLERLGALRVPEPLVPMPPLIRLMRECHGCWFQSLKQAIRARREPERIEQAYRRMELLFRLLDARVTAQGGRFAVLMIPTKIQVEPDDERGSVGRAARLLELPPTDLEYDAVAYQRIQDAAARAGVPVVDPLAELREDARRGRLYYRRDWHLNPTGNVALANVLYRQLTSIGLAP